MVLNVLAALLNIPLNTPNLKRPLYEDASGRQRRLLAENRKK